MHHTLRVFLCLMGGVFIAPFASGATLSLDPSQSTVTFTGNVLGFFQLFPQTPGSNVVTFAGDVDVDDSVPGFLTFNGANADAELQPDPQSPLPGGATGTAPA